VRPAPNYIPLPPAEALLPADLDPKLAIVACCRIAPDKKIEFLLDVMEVLNVRQPGASLTIVGGPDTQSLDYFQGLVSRLETSGLKNVFFVGPHADVLPLLNQASVFVMVSERQGCPNASLEAMSLGLPVVCNASGGSSEQVADGVNGYLVSTPEEMAQRVMALQKDSRLRRKMGRAGREIALKRFSMEAMVAAYAGLLAEGPTGKGANRSSERSNPGAQDELDHRVGRPRNGVHKRQAARAGHGSIGRDR